MDTSLMNMTGRRERAPGLHRLRRPVVDADVGDGVALPQALRQELF